MLTLDFANLGKDSHALEALEGRIPSYLKAICARGQGFYDLPEAKGVIEFGKMAEGKFNSVVVLGIGGSALGTICLHDSLKPLFARERTNSSGPRLYVVDNIDPSLIAGVEALIDLATTLFVVVTKSGGTPETLAHYFYFREQCRAHGLKEKEHFLFITDPSKGFLRRMMTDDSETSRDDFLTFPVPENVGGRFSVLTPVGLVPAVLSGLDVDKLLAGARAMRDRFLSENFEENLPFQLATAQFLADKPMHVLFPYSQRLIKFADWYRQLLAESLGKRADVGLTPISALGATDQHSQLQLYSDGPDDKFFMFVGVEDSGPDVVIPAPDDPDVAYLKGVTFGELFKTEMNGTVQALAEKGRPSITITISRVKEETLGALFMLMEASVAFLGEFYGIDAFNQPGVERSKILTREFLTSRQ